MALAGTIPPQLLVNYPLGPIVSIWQYQITSSNVPSDFNQGAEFLSTTCNGNLCLAVGFYTANYPSIGTVQYPLLAMSDDNGLTWTYPLSVTANIPADFYTGYTAQFNSVSCNSTACVAAENYNTGSGQFPLLAQSTDGGITWTYSISSDPGTLPPDYTSNGNFESVSCSESVCIAAGVYNLGPPMLAQSVNGGAWTYSIDSTQSLPGDYGGTAKFDGTATD